MANLSGAATKRRQRAVESFGAARDAIGPVEAGMSVFAITRGQWSMVDAIMYVADALGPGAGVSIWTWTIAEYEVKAFCALMERGDLSEGRLIIDMAADRRARYLLDAWRGRFGQDSVRVCRSHAKVARVWGGELRMLLRGSMNLNFNPRFEQFDATEGGDDYELVRGIEDAMPILRGAYTWPDVVAAGKLGQAFDQETMDAFGDLRELRTDGLTAMG